jgi:hypothetical protein
MQHAFHFPRRCYDRCCCLPPSNRGHHLSAEVTAAGGSALLGSPLTRNSHPQIHFSKSAAPASPRARLCIIPSGPLPCDHGAGTNAWVGFLKGARYLTRRLRLAYRWRRGQLETQSEAGQNYCKIVGTIFLSWWIFLLVIIGLAGNAYLAIKALQAGNIAAGLLFGVCFGGACVYCYRTYNARDEIRGIFRD